MFKNKTKIVLSFVCLCVVSIFLSGCNEVPKSLENKSDILSISLYHNGDNTNFSSELEIPDNYMLMSENIYAVVDSNNEIIEYKTIITNDSDGTSKFMSCDADGRLLQQTPDDTTTSTEPITEPSSEPVTEPVTEPPTSSSDPIDPIEPNSIKLSASNFVLNIGASKTVTATISPSNTENKSVSWNTSNSSVATVNNGKVIAVAQGSATITAKTSNGKTATCKVSVVVPTINPSGITLNKNSISLKQGETSSISATVSPSNANNKIVSWESSNNSIATVNNGTITAVGVGNATITAKTSNGITQTCSVSVSSNQAPFNYQIISQGSCPMKVSNEFDNYIISSSAKNIAIVNGGNTYILVKASAGKTIGISSVTESSGSLVVKCGGGSNNYVIAKVNRENSSVIYN